MNVYVTMNIYDYSEFSLWNIATRKDIAIKTYREEDLPMFLTGAQPDISILELRKVQMTKSDFEFMQKYLTNKNDCGDDADAKIEELLKELWEKDECDYIYSIGGDEVLDVAEYYCKCNGIDVPAFDADVEPDYWTVITEACNKLSNDEPLFLDTIHNYIKRYL